MLILCYVIVFWINCQKQRCWVSDFEICKWFIPCKQFLGEHLLGSLRITQETCIPNFMHLWYYLHFFWVKYLKRMGNRWPFWFFLITHFLFEVLLGTPSGIFQGHLRDMGTKFYPFLMLFKCLLRQLPKAWSLSQPFWISSVIHFLFNIFVCILLESLMMT